MVGKLGFELPIHRLDLALPDLATLNKIKWEIQLVVYKRSLIQAGG